MRQMDVRTVLWEVVESQARPHLAEGLKVVQIAD